MGALSECRSKVRRCDPNVENYKNNAAGFYNFRFDQMSTRESSDASEKERINRINFKSVSAGGRPES